MNSKRLTKKAIGVFIILAASKLLGLLRSILLAYRFGTSNVVDSYNIAISIPKVLFAIFASGLGQSYIPYYSRLDSDNRKQEFFSNTLSIFMVIAFAVSIVCYFLSDAITYVLAPGFETIRHDICSSFISYTTWMFPFYILYTVISAQLQTMEDFGASNFCFYIVVNIVVILSIIIATPDKPMFLAIGYTLSMAVASIMLTIYFVRKTHIKFIPRINGAYSEFRKMMAIAIPAGLSYMINELNSLTDSAFSSMFAGGVTSSLNYANKIQSLFLTLTTSVFMVVIFPLLNKLFAQNRISEGVDYLKKGVLLSAWLVIPFAFFVGKFSKEIVFLLFQRGIFDSTSTIVTSTCLRCYSFGIPFYALCEISSKTLTASLKQRIVLKDTLIAVIFNIVADFVTMKIIGYSGLALATSISGALLCTLYYLDLAKINLIIIDKAIVFESFKIILSSTVAAFMASLIQNILPKEFSSFVNMVAIVIVFGIVYLLMGMILRISVTQWISNRLKIGESNT